MAQRLAYRRRLSYNTPSNKVKKVRAPQCNLVLQYTKKRGKAPRCGDCNSVIAGIKPMRSAEYSRASKTKKSITRAYGGSRCASCVKTRIIRSFLIEERKVVTSMLKKAPQK